MRPGAVRARAPGLRAVAVAAVAATVTLAPAGVTAAETLADAWRMAAERNAGLAAAVAESEAARAGERAARAQRLPTLDAEAAYTRLDQAPALSVVSPGFSFASPPIFDDDDFLTGSARIRLPLYAGGSIAASVRSAREASSAAAASEQATGAALRLAVATAYIDVLRARRARQAAEANVESLAAHVLDVQSMAERELVAQSDLLASRVALANGTQARVRAVNGVALAHAAYNRLVGEPLERVPELEERIAADSALAAEDLDALVARATQARPEIAAAGAQARALQDAARAEDGRRRPQVGLMAGYSHLESEILDQQDFASVGVGFTWRLLDGGQLRDRSNQLRQSGRAAERRAEELRSLVALEVRRSALDVGEARARIAATREAVDQADEGLRITRELYGAGLATNTQVLEAVSLRVAATGNRDDAVLDEALALLRLARATGEL